MRGIRKYETLQLADHRLRTRHQGRLKAFPPLLRNVRHNGEPKALQIVDCRLQISGNVGTRLRPRRPCRAVRVAADW